YNLGYMYDFGYGGVPEDDTEAVKWYRKAAEQGYAQAQYNLGMAYYYGHGVPEDYVESYMWLNLAAAQGDENAKHNKGILSKQMTREQIAEAQKLSREWSAKRSE
ncbi:MAG: tetratricopeptide repeat protein, partial [Lentimonas sp.]